MRHPDEKRESDSNRPANEALRLHPHYRGKIQTALKCPVRSFDDFAIWYSPGVAAPCRAIAAQRDLVYEHTNRANTIAIVSNGTRVLGLGDIGPEAALPVMEGKALLFKYLGGVDAIPICVRAPTPDDVIRSCEMLEPTFAGINLEDIASPGCFRILDELRDRLSIPVWHDDQQGTAAVVLGALMSALKVVGKSLTNARIALIGAGAANVATYHLLKAAGIAPGAIVACDRKGTLHAGRDDLSTAREAMTDKWLMCSESNEGSVVGGIADAVRGADVCIAFSCPGPKTLKAEWLQTMAKDAIVFACANPVPEIWPWQAREAGVRIVATGRSDFPNQVNNALAFPGIFRGTLDVRASAISQEMALASARELSEIALAEGANEDRIVPKMDDPAVAIRVAVATAMAAQKHGLAAVEKSAEALYHEATDKIQRARQQTAVLTREGIIPPPPVD